MTLPDGPGLPAVHEGLYSATIGSRATDERPTGSGGTPQEGGLGVRDLAVDILHVRPQGCPLIFQQSEDLAGGCRRGRNVTGEK